LILLFFFSRLLLFSSFLYYTISAFSNKKLRVEILVKTDETGNFENINKPNVFSHQQDMRMTNLFRLHARGSVFPKFLRRISVVLNGAQRSSGIWRGEVRYTSTNISNETGVSIYERIRCWMYRFSPKYQFIRDHSTQGHIQQKTHLQSHRREDLESYVTSTFACTQNSSFSIRIFLPRYTPLCPYRSAFHLQPFLSHIPLNHQQCLFSPLHCPLTSHSTNSVLQIKLWPARLNQLTNSI
jgi:hypothetical protein